MATDATVLKKKLMAAAETKRDRLVDIVSRSVRIPSLSGSEQPVVEFYKKELAERKVERDIWNPRTAELKAHPHMCRWITATTIVRTSWRVVVAQAAGEISRSSGTPMSFRSRPQISGHIHLSLERLSMEKSTDVARLI